MINTFSTLIDKRGVDYLDKFLSEELVITEKLDTYQMIFEMVNGKLVFYKKDNTPISIIERTLNDVYEDAIIEITTLVGDTHLEENVKFGIYYTPVERPIRLPYSNIPKYILTHVTKCNESISYDEVEQYAAILCMGRPPVIFKGVLSEQQKTVLIDYNNKQFNGKDLSFVQMIKNTFNNHYSGEEIIEGIILKSKSNLAQITSYEFDLINESYNNETNRDFYDILLMNITNFMNDYTIPILENTSQDQMYINLVSDIFNKYCDVNSCDAIDPQYLVPPKYGYLGKLNKKFITNEQTLALVEKPIYESLFKVFLSSFRKKKKAYGLLSEAVVNSFNTYVYLVETCINKTLNEDRSDNIVIDTIKKRNYSDTDNMRVIASLQKTFQVKDHKIAKGTTKVVVYVTTFKPFNNAQLSNARQMADIWKCPIILMGISNEFKIKGKIYQPSDEIVRSQMKCVVEDNKELFAGYALLNSWNLKELFERCRPQFEPIAILTDMNKKSEYTTQLFFEEEIMGNRLSVETNFNIGEIENTEELMAFRSIEDANASYFANLTPKGIHNLYDMIINEYKSWSGLVRDIEFQK